MTLEYKTFRKFGKFVLVSMQIDLFDKNIYDEMLKFAQKKTTFYYYFV